MKRVIERVRYRAAAAMILMLLASSLIPVVAQTKRKRPVYYSVPANTVMRVRLNSELNSEKARVGDTFTATLVDPVYSSGGRLLAPQASTITGRVTNVQRAKKNGEPATLDVQFVALRLPNGVSRSISGSLTDLENSDNEGTVTAKKTSHRKVKFIGGGAAGGAVIGAIAGGGKGAAIGAGVGAVAGLITGRVKKGHEVKVKSGTEFGVITNRTFSLPQYRAS
jgi:hypothetical protein